MIAQRSRALARTPGLPGAYRPRVREWIDDTRAPFGDDEHTRIDIPAFVDPGLDQDQGPDPRADATQVVRVRPADLWELAIAFLAGVAMATAVALAIHLVSAVAR